MVALPTSSHLLILRAWLRFSPSACTVNPDGSRYPAPTQNSGLLEIAVYWQCYAFVTQGPAYIDMLVNWMVYLLIWFELALLLYVMLTEVVSVYTRVPYYMWARFRVAFPHPRYTLILPPRLWVSLTTSLLSCAVISLALFHYLYEVTDSYANSLETLQASIPLDSVGVCMCVCVCVCVCVRVCVCVCVAMSGVMGEVRDGDTMGLSYCGRERPRESERAQS
jgi:hypothetical protein